MATFKMTIEIDSLTEANALARALQAFIDCSEDMHREESKEIADSKAHGLPVEWRAERDNKQLGADLAAAEALLARIKK